MGSGRVGIVGFGRFGRALADLLIEAGWIVSGIDARPGAVPPELSAPDLATLAQGAEVVVVAVPVPAVESALLALLPHLDPRTLVIDVGSVKTGPEQALRKVLGARIPWAATHPLFGPTSLALGERPLRVVLCPNPLHPEAVRQAAALFEGLGCELIEQEAEAHDRAMAGTHALAFFVAKGLLDVRAGEGVPFTPPSFQAIARTIEAVRSDAGHLFSAIQRENPYARSARRRLLDALSNIEEQLDGPPLEAETLRQLAIPDLGSAAPDLRAARDLIDELDQQLVELLARRAQLARRAGRAKAESGRVVRDPDRERLLLERRRAWATAQALDPDGVSEVFEAILRLSRALQRDEREALPRLLASRGWSMIIMLQPDTGDRERVLGLISETAGRYPGITAKPYDFTGSNHTFTEVHLVGSTKTVPTDVFEAIPGVLRVVRVSAKYRLIGRHDLRNETVGFTYNGVTFDDRHLHLFAGLCAVDNRETLIR